MLFVPNNSKQIRGNCHNPIFIPEIFSGIGMQNEAVELSRVQPKSGSKTSKSSQNIAGGTFCEAWKGLTNVDRN
jgi:hypothetical protein